MDGLTEGRIVHYVLKQEPGCRSAGEHRPAIVVKVWDEVTGTCNLQVFTDFTNDYEIKPGAHGQVWATSVRYSENKEPGTWHWVEKA